MTIYRISESLRCSRTPVNEGAPYAAGWIRMPALLPTPELQRRLLAYLSRSVAGLLADRGVPLRHVRARAGPGRPGGLCGAALHRRGVPVRPPGPQRPARADARHAQGRRPAPPSDRRHLSGGADPARELPGPVHRSLPGRVRQPEVRLPGLPNADG